MVNMKNKTKIVIISVTYHFDVTDAIARIKTQLDWLLCCSFGRMRSIEILSETLIDNDKTLIESEHAIACVCL